MQKLLKRLANSRAARERMLFGGYANKTRSLNYQRAWGSGAKKKKKKKPSKKKKSSKKKPKKKKQPKKKKKQVKKKKKKRTANPFGASRARMTRLHDVFDIPH